MLNKNVNIIKFVLFLIMIIVGLFMLAMAWRSIDLYNIGFLGIILLFLPCFLILFTEPHEKEKS